MTLNQKILTTLAVVGAISTGVWSTLAVGYYITRDNLTAAEVESAVLRREIITMKDDKDRLQNENENLLERLESQQNLIVEKLIKS